MTAFTPVRAQAVSDIKSSIASGELKPGQRLIEREMSDRLKISRASLREAFRQLEAEGFLDIRPNKGPVVAVLTESQAHEIYEVREALECFAMRQFVERATDQEVELMIETSHALIASVLTDNELELLNSKNRLYDTLFTGTHNSFLYEQAKSLYTRVARLRARSLSFPGRREQSAIEIANVMDAVKARDTAQAEALWRLHVRNAARAAFGLSAI